MSQNISAVITIKDPVHILESSPALLSGQLTAAIRHTWGSTAEDLEVHVVTSNAEKMKDAPKQ